MQKMVDQAKRFAKLANAPRCVISIDYEAGRELSTCSESYVDSDEFQAFDGTLLAVVYPDGTVEA